MKRILTTLTLIAFAFCASASDADLFTYDQEALDQEFTELSTLESFVSSNADVSLSDLLAEDNEVLAGLDISAETASGLAMGMLEPPLGIPSFLWGCILGPIGIVLVYVISEDEDETKKALYGCLASVGAYLLFWVVYVLILGAGTGFLFI